MWIPKTEAELIQAVTSGSLEEGPTFDAKRELPPASRNVEIAKDVAAMANDGGVIIYGIDEDEHNRPTILSPISLAGQADRINSIVRSSIAEAPRIELKTIVKSDDPSVGYLIVIVPTSERAPHMVVVKGENRFYGRTATANTPLNEGDVARLYEQRRKWSVDRDELLAAEIAGSPYPHPPDEGLAYLLLVARPVTSSEALLSRAIKEGETIQDMISELISLAAKPTVFQGTYSPDFERPSNWIRRTEGYFAKISKSYRAGIENEATGALNLQIDLNGTGHLFCGSTILRTERGYVFYSDLVWGLATRFFWLLGQIYARGQYYGQVDIGLALIGIKDTVPYWDPYKWRNRFLRHPFDPYERNEYRRTHQAVAGSLNDDPKEIGRLLLRPLYDAMTQGRLDLFAPAPPASQ